MAAADPPPGARGQASLITGATLDANVLVPAALRDTLLRAAEAGLYHPYWSRDILAELHRVLIREELAAEQAAARLISVMQRAFPQAVVSDYEALVPYMKNHPGDRHVLAAAVRVGAAVIITHNRRHFPSNVLAEHGIVAKTPDQFLVDLFGGRHDVMVAVIQEQTADLRSPPRDVDDVLDTLAVNVPEFVSLIRTSLRGG